MVNVEVYGNIKATCTQRVLILLEELNLKYSLKNVDLTKGEQKDQDFLKLNPFGQIPAIEYGDRNLFESRSILRYIAKNNIDIEDLLGDTDTDLWLEVESQQFNPPASKIVYEKVFKKWFDETPDKPDKQGKPDEDILAESVKSLEKVLDVYEKQLENNNYISGDTYTIADISHIPYINQLLRCGYKDLFKSRPNVYKWVKRIIKRDNVQYILSESK
jgi:glutathione S-transferase